MASTVIIILIISNSLHNSCFTYKTCMCCCCFYHSIDHIGFFNNTILIKCKTILILFRIGIHAGVMLPPDGCAILKGEKCAFEFVSARDQTIKCEADIFG